MLRRFLGNYLAGLPHKMHTDDPFSLSNLSQFSEDGRSGQPGDSSPRAIAYYLERAAECGRLADAVTEENRNILRMLAARWRALAAEEEGSLPDTG